MGAEKSVVWESVPDVVPLVKKLKKEGWKIFAIEQAKNSMPYYLASDVLWNDEHQKAALVVGNEVGGIPPAILKLADAILEIPMLGKKESLNVSVAFGIAAYRSRFH